MRSYKKRNVVNRGFFFILFLAVLIGISGCILVPDQPAPTTTQTVADRPTFIPPTATIENQEPTKTDPAPEPTPTEVEAPTSTPAITATQTPVNTNTPAPFPTQTPTPLPFNVQANTPAYIANFAHPTAGCDWIGVAGQVFDLENKPAINIVAVVTGSNSEEVFEGFSVTGTEGADVYGPGGYEIVIGNEPFGSEDNFSIQLFDLSGSPISNDYSFRTFADCGKNLIIINFSPIE